MGCDCIGKCLLIVINLAFFIIALVFTALGGILLFGKDFTKTYLDMGLTMLKSFLPDFNSKPLIDTILKMLEPVAIVIFVFGIVLLIIAFLGMCGACCKNKVCLIIYCALVGIIVTVLLITVIVYFAKEKEINAKLVAYLKTTVEKYEGAKGTNLESVLWNLINMQLKCCGVEHGKEFETSKWYPKRDPTTRNYPPTCCMFKDDGKVKDENCIKGVETSDNSNFEKGCYKTLWKKIHQYFIYFIGGIIGVILFMIILIICAVCIIKNSDKVV